MTLSYSDADVDYCLIDADYCLIVLLKDSIQNFKWELKNLNSLELKSQRSKEEEEDAYSRKLVVLHHIDELTNLLAGTTGQLPSSCTSTNHKVEVEPLEKGRYLLVSFGFTICCFDLKSGDDDAYELPAPPIISTLKLLEESKPVSMGLFKVNSDVFLFGGQEFPAFKTNPPSLWNANLFEFLYAKHGVKGSSRDTYHLSSSLPDRTLSLSECNVIGPLNKPKIWPIVEKIGDKLHVIESLPRSFAYCAPKTIPTHEVLNLHDLDSGWKELSPLRLPHRQGIGMHLSNHIVIGDRIYAHPLNARGCAVFDSKTDEWELRDHKLYDQGNAFSIKHVAQIFNFGCGRCVRVFLLGKLSRSMYVLVVLGHYGGDRRTVAVAYLVTSTGQVLGFQRLPSFFEEFNCLFEGVEARVIDVDEHGETMCAIFQGITFDTLEEFLFISFFTVEEVPDAMALSQGFESLISDEDDVGKLPNPLEVDFVRVDVKKWFVSDKEVQPQEKLGMCKLPGLSACFL